MWHLDASGLTRVITVKVLLENSRVSREFQQRHGLSLAIERDDELLLVDVGPDRRFLRNAPLLGVDVAAAKTVVLSHHHMDHSGGLDATTHMLRHEPGGSFPMPSLNASLLMRQDGRLVPDDFRHEGVLVIEDDGELVLFNSCSHNGVINSIELVQRRFPGKPIRAYVGGFHFRDPITKRTEKPERLQEFASWFADNDIRLYPGHCTGQPVIEQLQRMMGAERVVAIRTGMVVEV